MAGNVLVVGAGGVSSVSVHKMAMTPERFGRITLASRTKSKCDAIAESVKTRTGVTVETMGLDAMDISATVTAIKAAEAEIVVNLALPYQDLALMEACLEAGVHYLDTANYEAPDALEFEYSHQWALQAKFRDAGLTAILGCGFDPGVTSAFANWLRTHKLDSIRQIDILDCNGGDNGLSFATNFNPEINLREVTLPAKHWEAGTWQVSPAMTHRVDFDFPAVGEKAMYLMYHEELESLVTHYPEIERARFWMTFGDAYIKHVEVLESIGMTRIDPVEHNGQQIIPLEFLKSVLPNPAGLGAITRGKTCIGDIATGQAKDGGGEATFYIYNICDHEETNEEVGSQAVAYTTGVPAMLGTALVLDGTWRAPGVWNIEQLDVDPFMAMLTDQGLPWQVVELPGPVGF